MAHGLHLAIPKTPLDSIKMTTMSKPYSEPCIMRLILHMMRTLNPSSRNPNRHESLLSCCRMFVVAATFIQSYAKTEFWTRTSKNVGGGLDEKIKLSDVLVKRRKALLDQATISTEITAFQILHQERPTYATGNYRQSIARQLTISSYLSEVLLPIIRYYYH
ncbi:hypothetical protein BGY98DRAFT_1192133 [Russula aff. rugulosa BPL654]|nr:hypothetical protein BGY98DRAFT_1192133 [Russula aff. rugulosa BPL654]